MDFNFKKQRNDFSGENEYLFSLSEPSIGDINQSIISNFSQVFSIPDANSKTLSFFIATKYLTQIQLDTISIEKLLKY